MNNNNDDVLNRIVNDKPPLESDNEQLRSSVSRWFDGRRNLWLVYSSIHFFISIVLFWCGFNFMFFAEETLLKMVGMILIGASLSIQIVVRLGYWIMDAKIAAVKELKKIQLQSLDTLNESEETTEALRESILPEKFKKGKGTFWASINRKTIEWTAFIVFVVFGGAAGFVWAHYDVPYRWFVEKQIRVEQTDEWRISSTDWVEARSIIAYERWLYDEPIITIDLPVLNAEVQTVTHKGTPLLFKRIDERRCDVQLPVATCGEEGRLLIEVKWRFPFQALGRDGDNYRARLISLIPTNQYALYIRSEGEFAGRGFGSSNTNVAFGDAVEDYPSLRDFDLNSGRVFFTNSKKTQRQYFGSCGVINVPSEKG